MDVELYKAATKGEVELLHKHSSTSRHEDGDDERSTHTHGKYFLYRTHQNNNIVHLAARRGHASFIQEALTKFSILFDQVNSNGDTPLHIAAKFDHLNVVELLVSHYKSLPTPHQEDRVMETKTRTTPARVDVLPPLWRVTNLELMTALDESLRNGHEKVALFLLRLDPEMACFVNGARESPLYLAAESCCEEVLKEILDSKLPYSVQGPHGQNALHAAKYCTETSIEILLSKRPELARGVDDSGKTALHYAVEAYHMWLIPLLLKPDTSIANLPDMDGLTPLLRASSRGCLGICQTILKLCPESIEARTNNGQNVVHLFKSRWLRTTKLFLKIPEIREIINERDDNGNTPLQLAIKNHDHTKARLLVSTGIVDLRAINKEGLTAMDMCGLDWKLSYRQRMMWFHLGVHKAPYGRHPNQFDVPIGGPKTAFIEHEADWKLMANSLTLIATLLATVTFTAVFTMPGGYSSSSDNLGVAVLIKKAALKLFILADTFAMCCSITVVFFLIWAMLGEPKLLQALTNISRKLIGYGLYGTLVAFVSGVFAVTASEALWVAIIVCIMASVVPFVVDRHVVMSSATCIWRTHSNNQWPQQRKGKRKRQALKQSRGRLDHNARELEET